VCAWLGLQETCQRSHRLGVRSSEKLYSYAYGMSEPGHERVSVQSRSAAGRLIDATSWCRHKVATGPLPSWISSEVKKKFRSIRRPRFFGGTPFCGDGALTWLNDQRRLTNQADHWASEWLGLRELGLGGPERGLTVKDTRHRTARRPEPRRSTLT